MLCMPNAQLLLPLLSRCLQKAESEHAAPHQAKFVIYGSLPEATLTLIVNTNFFRELL